MKLQFPPSEPFSLTPAWLSQATVDRGEYTFAADIPFLGPQREEKMDAYFPKEPVARPAPAILLIHGGGWCICDKADLRERNIGSNLASAGYAVFSINYALNLLVEGGTRGIAWPQNYEDCKSGLRFLRAHAEVLGIDPTRVATMGGSAGGHLAMLVGATSHEPSMNRGGLYTDQANDVSCIINFYGLYDMLERPEAFSGATPQETRAIGIAASPSTYFGPQTPPVFIAHGTADQIVPVEVSYDLVRLLTKHGITHEYVEVPGAPHTFHLQPEQLDLRPAVLSFLAKYL